MRFQDMKITTPSHLALAAMLAAAVGIGAWTSRHPIKEPPSSAQIELAGMSALQQSEARAERHLRDWAAQGMPVAQRELAILYQTRPGQRDEAMKLFALSARGG